MDLDEEFCPNWIVLDPELPLTRLRNPRIDGQTGPGQVPYINEVQLLCGAGVSMPCRRSRVFTVNPLTWANLPGWVLATLEPYELKTYRQPGQSIKFPPLA